MPALHRLYRNRLIPQGRYFVKIIDLRTEPAGAARRFIEVVLRVSDVHEGVGGTELYCPIHATANADAVYEAFLRTFDLEPQDLHRAVGRYALVAVKHCEHKKTRYAAVRFVAQRECDYADAPAARKRDEQVAAQKEAHAKEKAALKAKKRAEKEAWEARFGKRGRGRPPLTPFTPKVDLFA